MLGLNKKLKKAIFLLQIGTFLEYFDLMLFVFMAVILNEVFFPQFDVFTNSLLAAFTYCATYALKPFSALLFGYISEKVGRKHTVIITTIIMAISCIIIANAPTYAQIGITASWIVTLCRGLQGVSSVGESKGEALSIVNRIEASSSKYQAIGLIDLSGMLGMTAAVIVAEVGIFLDINWRIIFWTGALIALMCATARVMWDQAPDPIFAKHKQLTKLAKAEKVPDLSSDQPVWETKVSRGVSVAYFMVFCGWPFCYYFSYVYCGGILKNQFYYTKETLIHHNLIVSLFSVAGLFIWVWLTKKINPLIVLKTKLIIYVVFLSMVPWLLSMAKSQLIIIIIQVLGMVFGHPTIPATSVFLSHFPIFKRLHYTRFITAFSHFTLYIIASFGLVYAVKVFGNYGILLISLPIPLVLLLWLLHFEKLEKYAVEYRSMEQIS